MVARLARDEQSRALHDLEVTGERGVGDAQVLGDLAGADVVLVLEVVEDLGTGHVRQRRVSLPITSFGISGHNEIILSDGVCGKSRPRWMPLQSSWSAWACRES